MRCDREAMVCRGSAPADPRAGACRQAPSRRPQEVSVPPPAKADLPRNRQHRQFCHFKSWIMTISQSLITGRASRRSASIRVIRAGRSQFVPGLAPERIGAHIKLGNFHSALLGEVRPASPQGVPPVYAPPYLNGKFRRLRFVAQERDLSV
jgi:hypothetical protein